MKKLATIQSGHNNINIQVEGNATFVKIYTKTGKLIRHSRIKGNSQVIFSGKNGDYIIETNGKFKDFSSNKRSKSPKPKVAIRIQKADEDGIKSLHVNGLPFNSNKIKTLVDSGIFEVSELKTSLKDYYEAIEKKAKAEILTDDIVRESSIGAITAAKKNKIKAELAKISKEKTRVNKVVDKTSDLEKLILIKTKFPKLKTSAFS